MCEDDQGMLGTIIYGEALDVGVPQVCLQCAFMITY
jgi:hypothetical protein